MLRSESKQKPILRVIIMTNTENKEFILKAGKGYVKRTGYIVFSFGLLLLLVAMS